MSGATWGQLWSGIFGAVIGALAAAAVALLVVWLSNRHQKKLSDAAMREQQRLAWEALNEQGRIANAAIREQQRLAGEALSEQRRLADAAFTEQRSLAAKAARAQTIQYQRELLEQGQSVKLQLDEQRLEASKARELAAIADAMAAVTELVAKYSKGAGEIDAAIQSMRAAVFRWGFEHHVRSEVDELNRWPHHLAMLAYTALKSLATPPTDADFDILNNASNLFLTLVSGWPASNADQRSKLVKALNRARLAPSPESSMADLFAD